MNRGKPNKTSSQDSRLLFTAAQAAAAASLGQDLGLTQTLPPALAPDPWLSLLSHVPRVGLNLRT